DKRRADLSPFIVWSEEDDIVSSHDNFNKYGPFQLMKEHFGVLPEYLSSQYGDISSRLWFKKYQFLASHNVFTEVSLADEEHFGKISSNKRVLYIDDEHRLGWSSALYSLLSGSDDLSHYQLFQGGAPFISTPDNRFACIDNMQEALKVLEGYHETWERALIEYSEAERLRNQIAGEIAGVRKAFVEIEEKTKSAEATFAHYDSALRESQNGVRDAQS